MTRRLTRLMAALLMVAASTVAVAPVADAGVSRPLAVVYQHAWWTGDTVTITATTDYGDCDSAGYFIELNWPYGPSSVRSHPYSPSCNWVVIYKYTWQGWVVCHPGGRLPLSYIGADCNDRGKLKFRVRYLSKTDSSGV